MVLIIESGPGLIVLETTDTREIEAALNAIGAVRRERKQAVSSGKAEGEE